MLPIIGLIMERSRSLPALRKQIGQIENTMKVALLLIIVCCSAPYSIAAQSLPLTEADKVGFSSKRLKIMHDWLQAKIRDGLHAGAVSLIAKDGKIVDWKSYGYRDLKTRDPMEKNDIFRIFSMTKVIVSVAALQLYEKGVIQLNDPVSKFIPEIDTMKVYVSGKGDQMVLEEQKVKMTIKHLLTNTSGIPYEFTAGDALYDIWKGHEEFYQGSGSGFIRELVKKTLAHQPAERFTYGSSTDVLGLVIEAVSGMSLGEYLDKNILAPLGMGDTFFEVPASKRERLVSLYTHQEGELKHLVPADRSEWYTVPPKNGERMTGIESGGGGLYSTASDYAVFAQMLLNQGIYNGVRILSPKTVESMTSNHLEGLGDGTHQFNDFEGFGLGVSVRVSLPAGNTLGSLGQYGWNGGFTTFYSADPKEGLFSILLLQHDPYDQHGIFPHFPNLYYQSLLE